MADRSGLLDNLEGKVVCAGHIIGVCQNCLPDSKNQDCPNYKPKIIYIIREKNSIYPTDNIQLSAHQSH
ncbi:MAG: hypothetical protein AABX29_03510 [Nanoarchaeota archaeon]